jgi:hypothetical protein
MCPGTRVMVGIPWVLFMEAIMAVGVTKGCALCFVEDSVLVRLVTPSDV